MATDFTPYVIIPEELSDRVSQMMSLAIKMAETHFPHLVDGFKFTQKRYTEEALSFTGSHNFPSKTTKTFKQK